jgi:VIT1/CCC1 family predicted Fe2+/Mn2+ transporter
VAKMVQIAAFAERHDAELAAYFLQRHGLNAFAGASYHGEVQATSTHMRNADCPVWVSHSDYREARRLLDRVRRGEFSDADPEKDSREGLGAALGAAIGPTPGYRSPSSVALLAPFAAILAFFALFLVVAVVGSLLRNSQPEPPPVTTAPR